MHDTTQWPLLPLIMDVRFGSYSYIPKHTYTHIYTTTYMLFPRCLYPVRVYSTYLIPCIPNYVGGGGGGGVGEEKGVK